jgi:hypothetical protein
MFAWDRVGELAFLYSVIVLSVLGTAWAVVGVLAILGIGGVGEIIGNCQAQ